MNEKVYLAAIAIVWAGVGAGIATIYAKQHYRKIAEEEIRSVKEAYLESAPKPAKTPVEARDEKPLTKDELEGLRNQLTNRVAYSSMTRVYAGDAVEVENDEIPKIFVIDSDTFEAGDTDQDTVSLTYFEEDDVLIDEQEEIIDVPEALLEDGLENFGKGSGDPNIVFVRNFNVGIDYEVVRDPRSYAEVVGGLRRTKSEKIPERFRDDN